MLPGVVVSLVNLGFVVSTERMAGFFLVKNPTKILGSLGFSKTGGPKRRNIGDYWEMSYLGNSPRGFFLVELNHCWNFLPVHFVSS